MQFSNLTHTFKKVSNELKLEEIESFAIAAEQREEPTISDDALLTELKRDGLIRNDGPRESAHGRYGAGIWRRKSGS